MKDFDNLKDSALELLHRGVRAMEQQAIPETTTQAPGANYVPMTVTTFDNHVYFYAKVDTDRCLDLLQQLRNVDNELRRQHMSRSLPDEYPNIPIWLHMQSEGGDLFTGLNLADQIRTIESPIYSIVEGLCASAATLISISCNRRYILPSSFMLIHQLSSHMWGKFEEFEDELALQQMAMDRLYEIYAERTNLTKAKAKQLLRRDTWLNALQTIEMGLADDYYK